MRIAIVDDIAEERKLLRSRLEDRLHRSSIHADFFEYENGEDFLIAAKQQTFTVLFLDIYMNGTNGIETAKELRKFDKDSLLVFITTSTDHALEGFQVRAIHYLVKPYTADEIDLLVDEIISRIPEPDKVIQVKVSGSDVRLRLKDIVYAEHFSHMIHIHTANKNQLITRQSFGEFIAPLKKDSRFFLCSRGVIANMEHATDFDNAGFVMDDGSRVLVNHKLLKTARQTFMDFLFERGHI